MAYHHDSPTDSFYNTQAWKKARAAYKKSKGGLCERCLKAGLVRPGTFVHHKTHLTVDNITNPDITLGFQNMCLLCRECHAAEHSKKRYIIDANGYAYGKEEQH